MLEPREIQSGSSREADFYWINLKSLELQYIYKCKEKKETKSIELMYRTVLKTEDGSANGGTFQNFRLYLINLK